MVILNIYNRKRYKIWLLYISILYYFLFKVLVIKFKSDLLKLLI